MKHEAAMLGGVVMQSLAIYACLVVALATAGRRQVGQLTLLDYLIVALLGSAVETGLYQGGGSFWAGIVSAVTLLAANRCLRLVVQRVPRLRRFLAGAPVLVVHDGQILWPNLARAQLTEQELMTAIRLRGYDRLDVIRIAVVESNGALGVVPRERGG